MRDSTAENVSRRAFIYQTAVTAAGLCLWTLATIVLLLWYPLREQLITLAVLPLVVVVGMFPTSFTPPFGRKFTKETITFTASDAFILIVACSYGVFPAVVIAGVDAFISSLRTVRRLSSNLFSAGMISLSAAMGGYGLHAVLRYGFAEKSFNQVYPFRAATVALLVGSILQVIVNWGLLSTLLALRHDSSILREWKEKLVWAIPMFLPTGTAATLLYLALHYDGFVMAMIGGPILIAIYFGHRRSGDGIRERIRVMEKAHCETIEALAVAINAKDEVTHEHVLRVQIYAAGVARLMGCDDAEIEALKAGALLHDIGKIAVPDYILNKPGKLTAPEFEQMKMHTIVGAQILGRVDFPYPVVPIVRHHHERWDGGGYPDGLKGEEIPLTARILTVVDCFDALREDRQYRRGLSRAEALEFLLKNSGSQYDPRVVGLFITHLPEFEAEIAAHKGQSVPTYGIEPTERLSEAALRVAPAAGLATEDTVAVSETRFTDKELLSFYNLVRTLSTTSDRNELLSTFAGKLSSIASHDTCAIALIAGSGEIVTEYACGQHAEAIKGRRVGLGEGITGWVIANQKPFCNTDPRLDFPPELAEKFQNFRTLASFPLLEGDRLLGALTVYSSNRTEYGVDQQRLLKESAAILTNALRAISEKVVIAPDLAGDLILLEQNPPLPPHETSLESELTH